MILSIFTLLFILSYYNEINFYSSFILLILLLIPFITVYSIGYYLDAVCSIKNVFSKYLGILSFFLFFSYDQKIFEIITISQTFSILDCSRLIVSSFSISALCASVILLINLTIEIPLRLIQAGTISSSRFSYQQLRIYLVILILSVSFNFFLDYISRVLYV